VHIQFLTHASAVVSTTDAVIWSDPWLSGSTFAGGWGVHPEASLSDVDLDAVQYLYISHEHPDHLHFPTLRQLPMDFRQRVTVLYQSRNSDDVLAALRKLGFARFRLLKHRAWVELTAHTSIYCYHAPCLDSCLGIVDHRNPGSTVLNVNDANLDNARCSEIRADLGTVDVVLNQVSFDAPSVQKALGARLTIPFACSMYYARTDNESFNRTLLRQPELYRHMTEAGCEVALLYPGDSFDTAERFDSLPNLERYEALIQEIERLEKQVPRVVQPDALGAAFRKLCAELRTEFAWPMLARLGPVIAYVRDLDQTFVWSIPDCTFAEITDDVEPHIELRSDVLAYMFANTWGREALDIAGLIDVRRRDRALQWNEQIWWMRRTHTFTTARHLFTKRGAKKLLDWAYQHRQQLAAIIRIPRL